MYHVMVQVVNIFNEELEKATSDKNSALRLWLNLIYTSKNDLQVLSQFRHLFLSMSDVLLAGYPSTD